MGAAVLCCSAQLFLQIPSPAGVSRTLNPKVGAALLPEEHWEPPPPKLGLLLILAMTKPHPLLLGCHSRGKPNLQSHTDPGVCCASEMPLNPALITDTLLPAQLLPNKTCKLSKAEFANLSKAVGYPQLGYSPAEPEESRTLPGQLSAWLGCWEVWMVMSFSSKKTAGGCISPGTALCHPAGDFHSGWLSF